MASAFSAIRGQDQAVGRLRALLAEGRVPHALLFSGPVGVGKSEAARALTQALQCRQAGDDGCGHCEPCRKVLLGKHPDVVTLRVAEGKTRLTIDQVRGLQGSLAYRPFEDTYTVSTGVMFGPVTVTFSHWCCHPVMSLRGGGDDRYYGGENRISVRIESPDP